MSFVDFSSRALYPLEIVARQTCFSDSLNLSVICPNDRSIANSSIDFDRWWKHVYVEHCFLFFSFRNVCTDGYYIRVSIEHRLYLSD